MKRILIAEDESQFRLALIEILNKTIPQIEIYEAADGVQGLNLAKQYIFDLIIADVAMPNMDGFEMIHAIWQFQPKVQIIVMTAFHTSELYNKLKQFEMLEYLQKPFDFKTLTQLVMNVLNIKTKASLSGIDISNMLQLLEMEQKTCTVKVTSKNKTGYLYFRKGELINAATGFSKGLDAAYSIINWEAPEVEIDDLTDIVPKEINKKIMAILLEASRIRDEGR